MSSLITISTAETSASGEEVDLARHRIHSLPVLVISPHNQCNCRCVMCDIWRIREPREISAIDLQQHLSSFRELGVRWVVFSGGEPQLNSELPSLARMLRAEGIRVTILTAGLLLEPQAKLIAGCVDDVIASLDGPLEVHNKIRRVPEAFERLAAGVSALRRIRPDMNVSARCTVQKANHSSLCQTVESAKKIGMNSISFLAADLTSEAFNRPDSWAPERQEKVALDANQVEVLDEEIEQLIIDRASHPTFIAESDAKLRKLVHHFRAHLGTMPNVAPRCNAPWVSVVIDASGEIRPCFFHPPMGNIYTQTLPEILNSPGALYFRSRLDIASNPICQRCVCSLHIARDDRATV